METKNIGGSLFDIFADAMRPDPTLTNPPLSLPEIGQVIRDAKEEILRLRAENDRLEKDNASLKDYIYHLNKDKQ